MGVRGDETAAWAAAAPATRVEMEGRVGVIGPPTRPYPCPWDDDDSATTAVEGVVGVARGW
jgi:hypothetical protein